MPATRTQTQLWGELTCRVARTSDGFGETAAQDEHALTRGVDLACVLCHGFGAPGDDLAPVAGEMASRLGDAARRVLWVFPAAPLALDELGFPGGRAWWWIDLEKLIDALQRGETGRVHTDCPPGLPEARQKLLATLDEVRRRTGLPPERVVLGGFSQGAMLAVDVALRWPAPPALLVAWSGAVVNEGEWRQLAAARRGLPVVQSHGALDPILPIEEGRHLQRVLEDAGLAVEFIDFMGPHAIPGKALQSFAQRLSALLT